MQTVNVENESTECTDAKVFCTNTECQTAKEEAVVLRQQVRSLNETILSLQNTIKAGEMRYESVQRDNERLSGELKKQQRCNRNIKQQLDDERLFYQREKDYFNEETQRLKSRSLNVNNKSKVCKEIVEATTQDPLEDENKSLKLELSEKCETTYNLCIKFLRMKHAKDVLRQKLDQLLAEYLRVMVDMMENLDEGRRELNIIVSEKFQEPLPVDNATFLQIVQRNARLVHENARLKVQVQRLTLNIEKLRSIIQKPKLINVDAKIINKLTAQCKPKYSKESIKSP